MQFAILSRKRMNTIFTKSTEATRMKPSNHVCGINWRSRCFCDFGLPVISTTWIREMLFWVMDFTEGILMLIHSLCTMCTIRKSDTQFWSHLVHIVPSACDNNADVNALHTGYVGRWFCRCPDRRARNVCCGGSRMYGRVWLGSGMSCIWSCIFGCPALQDQPLHFQHFLFFLCCWCELFKGSKSECLFEKSRLPV